MQTVLPQNTPKDHGLHALNLFRAQSILGAEPLPTLARIGVDAADSGDVRVQNSSLVVGWQSPVALLRGHSRPSLLPSAHLPGGYPHTRLLTSERREASVDPASVPQCCGATQSELQLPPRKGRSVLAAGLLSPNYLARPRPSAYQAIGLIPPYSPYSLLSLCAVTWLSSPQAHPSQEQGNGSQ